MGNNIAFSVENLSFSYGDNLILDHISVEIKKRSNYYISRGKWVWKVYVTVSLDQKQ